VTTTTTRSAPDLTARLAGLPPEEATAVLFAAIPGITYREVAETGHVGTVRPPIP